MSGCIGMNDSAISPDQKQAGAESVKQIGECRRFALLEINHFADEHCTAHVRHHQRHATAHLIIDHALRVAPDDRDKRTAQCRFFKNAICCVHQTLGLHPLLKEPPFVKFVRWHKLQNAHGLVDVEERQARDRVELGMRCRIKLHIAWVDAKMIVRRAGFADGILGEKTAGLAANEFADFREHIGPERGIERRIVNVANKAGQHLLATHGRCGPCGNWEPLGFRLGFQRIQLAHNRTLSS